MRKITQKKINRIFDLYRDGLAKKDIMIVMSREGFDISESTYWRLLRLGGGFTVQDNIKHHQSKLRKETK